MLADRWGRKATVILGYILGAVAWAFVPIAVSQNSSWQLPAVCTCFLVGGIAGTFVSGAKEAWVVDNLAHQQKIDLIETYFSRDQSFEALGATFAAALVLLGLFIFPVSQAILDGLWQIMAAGLIIAALILATIRESPYAKQESVEISSPYQSMSLHSIHMLLKRPSLRMFSLVMIIGSFAGSIVDEAFDISLVSRGMDARAFAALGVADNIVWIIAPLAGLFFVQKVGLRRVLTLFLALPAVAVCLFFLTRTSI